MEDMEPRYGKKDTEQLLLADKQSSINLCHPCFIIQLLPTFSEVFRQESQAKLEASGTTRKKVRDQRHRSDPTIALRKLLLKSNNTTLPVLPSSY